MTKKPTTTESYTADDIESLEGLAAVRKVPGMYIGETDSSGLQHMCWEIIDNAVDEAIAGHADTITVTLHTDGSVAVSDNGRGIPTGINAKSGITAVELVFTKLHAGGKFSGAGYKVSGGLHGVGASVVNALSDRLDVEVDQGGKTHTMSFRRGEPGEFSANGTFTAGSGLKIAKGAKPKATGTRVRFWPDMTIFAPDSEIDLEALYRRALTTTHLVANLSIVVNDERTGESKTFAHAPLSELVRTIATGTVLHEPLVFSETLVYETVTQSTGKDGEPTGAHDVERAMEVDVALAWTTGDEPITRSFVNIVATPAGGTHVQGFEKAVTKVVGDLANGYKPKRGPGADDEIERSDVLDGLVAVVSVKFPEPRFSSQTKDKLTTAAATKVVTDVVSNGLTAAFTARGAQKTAKMIADKVLQAARLRTQLKERKETLKRKTALTTSSLPAKLVDCHGDDFERSELHLIEGDSAMGCLKYNSLIQCADGHARTMAELADDWSKGITHFGYATDERLNVVVVPLLEPRVTHASASLVAVHLDNGEVIECTPDHPFRLSDGTYIRADALVAGSSLMPLYRRFSTKPKDRLEGYEMVWHPGRNRWEYTHRLADEWNLAAGADSVDNGTVRHHRDFDKRNNDPRNLRRMTYAAHSYLHSTVAGERWEDPEYRAHHTAINQERTRRPEEVAKRIAGFYSWYESLPLAERDAMIERLYREQEEYWSDPANRAAQAERIRAYYAENPDAVEQRRSAAIALWDNEELRAWRSEMTKQQLASPDVRRAHSDKVYAWLDAHPEWREAHSERMRTYMAGDLKERIAAGRRRYVEETPRVERVARLRAGQVRSALVRLNSFVGTADPAAMYEADRRGSTRMSYAKLLLEFDGDEARLLEAAMNANHKVVKVAHLDEAAAVYDLTVDVHHNFALASGVFVHNSARAARDSEFQALLPLRGKILNTWRANEKKMLDNAECASLISAIGAGAGKTFDLEAMRYGKIVIMTDADVDGSHIRSLLITFFCSYMTPMVAAGRLYAAVPPLHKIVVSGADEPIYTYSEAERAKVVADLEAKGKKIKELQRYKGLGEMDADQLAETTMDPHHRTMRRVNLGDAAEAEAILELLMGNKVEPRRDFIVEKGASLDWSDLDL